MYILWLMRMDDRELMAFQLLFNMPFVFETGSQLGTVMSLLYSCISLLSHTSDGASPSNVMSMKIMIKVRVIRDGTEIFEDQLRNVEVSCKRLISESGWTKVYRNFAQWFMDGIRHVWETKKLHKLAHHLGDLLAAKDDSQPAAMKRHEPIETEPTQNIEGYSAFIPLLLAAAS
ncbi:hypothetical protein VNO77_01794 [Canavalia gladiata]|uniref:Uncharacterized protein n=1 Tax=Canavalia gladiata TaxID=3824 RepID=A0AAN9MWY0_CANGL